MSKKPKASFIVEDPNGQVRQINLVGRFTQTLGELVRSRGKGITALDLGGTVRLSHYVWVLRKNYDLDIETANERHGGSYSGTHGRYFLRSNVTLPSCTDAA